MIRNQSHQENWNPESQETENPSNPIPFPLDTEAEISQDDIDNTGERTSPAGFDQHVGLDNDENPLNPDDPDNSDWRFQKNVNTINTDKTRKEDEYKQEDSLNRDRRNREEDANTSTGEDNRRGQDVE